MSKKRWSSGRRKIWFFVVPAVLFCLLTVILVRGYSDYRTEQYGTVKITPEKPDTVSVGYRIEADLKRNHDEEFGDGLYSKLEKHWEWWNEKDRMEQLFSSTLPGYVTINPDTWEACEGEVGFAMDNPLESCGWLEIADYMGIALDEPAALGERKHTEIHWNGSNQGEIFQVNVTSGYRYEEMRVTFNITADSEGGIYESGSYWNENVAFEIEDYLMKNKNTAQLVTVLGTQRYTSVHAYFVQEGMLYRIQVVGDPGQEKEVREVMERILGEF